MHSHLPAVPTSLGDQSESENTDELDTTEDESEDTIALQSDHIDTGFSTEAEDPTDARPSSSSDPGAHSTPRWHQPSRPSLLARLFATLISLSPPLVASLLALFCVLVPPVQRFLNSKEMIPLKGTLDNLGACSVPLTMIVLGGWFWDGEKKSKSNGRASDGVVKGGSDGQAKITSKGKGKGVETRHRPTNDTVPALVGERHHETTTLRQRHHVIPICSRESSSGSLSSMIGAFGDVLMARIHPRAGARRARRRARDTRNANHADVESGLLATHTETEHEHAENGSGRASRSRSRSWGPAPGLSPTPASPTPPPALTPRTNPPGETLTVVVTLLARMIIVPLVVTPMIVLVTRFGLGGQVFEEYVSLPLIPFPRPLADTLDVPSPVFIVSSMLLVASPPALTLAQVPPASLLPHPCSPLIPKQISQRAKVSTKAGVDTTPTPSPSTDADADAVSPFERLLSRTVFWAYSVLTPPLTILSVMIGLLLVGA